MCETSSISEMSNPSKTRWLGFQEMSPTCCIMTKEGVNTASCYRKYKKSKLSLTF